MLHYLNTYEGRTKVFLVLLVFFIAAAVTVNFYLLMTSRDAVMAETAERILLVAEAVRVELRLAEAPMPGREGGSLVPPASQTRLARLAHDHHLARMELLDPGGKVVISSIVGRVGAADSEFTALGAARRLRLESGGGVVGALRDREGIAYATLSGFLPVVGPSGRVRSILKVEEPAGDLARLDRSLKVLSAVQAAGLSCLVLLVLFFARWLLTPYRKLLATAERASESEPGPEIESADPDMLLQTFQAVVEKLKEQERELLRLKSEKPAGVDEEFPAEGLASSLNSGMMAIDADGRVRLVNPAALQILGRAKEEMVGRRVEDLFGEEDPLGKLLALARESGAPRSREMVPHRRKDGREIHLGVGLSPILRGEGVLRGVICLLSDLTEIRHLRDRVALKENLSHLGELSAGIAHEFRNSLATVQGYARLLQKCADAEARELSSSILKEAAGIGKVVEEFLQFARPAALNVSEVDLREVLDKLAREVTTGAGLPAESIRVAGEFPRMKGDEALLRRAFHNLILNACQARNGRPMEVRVFGEVEEGDTVKIEVEDNGKGIEPEILPRIFTPFFTTRPDGTGLGLPLAQKAIVSHDGSIEVTSQPGKGTRFIIRLPRAGPAVSSSPS